MTGIVTNHLGPVDYIVVAATLFISLFIGMFYALKGRKSSNNEELLTGSRKMGVLPIAASMLVGEVSAITILGWPAEVYSYGIQIFMLVLMGPVFTLAAIWLFLEVLYDLKLTSAYKYLELRYDSFAVRWMGSLIFIVQLLLISGIVMYAPALVLETMMGMPVWISVTAIASFATIYTSIGGIKAVVWTDVFQFIMISIGMSSIVVKALSKAGGLVSAFEIAGNSGRLRLFDWTIDPFMRHNTLNLFLGKCFASVFIVTHQPIVQRYCSLPTFRDAVKSVLWNYVFTLITSGLVVLAGIAIFAAHSECDPITSGQISRSDQIVPYFVIQELAVIPGMMGLFIAVVFSAVLSSISSTLNSLAAVTWDDFLVKTTYFRNMDDKGQSLTYKCLTIVYAVAIVVLAFYAENLGSILQAAITVTTTAIGVKGSVFLMGVFMPFVNKIGAVAGMTVGFIMMGFLSVSSFILKQTYNFQPMLNFTIEGCSSAIWTEFGNVTLNNSSLLHVSDLSFPTKIATVSYILYPVIGGIITIITAVLVSLLSGGKEQARFVKPEYLHGIVRPSGRAIGMSGSNVKKSIKDFSSEPEVQAESKL